MDDPQKPHRKRQAGRKADKKKKNVNTGQKNPKAFAYNSAKSAAKAFHRTADVLEKKHHLLVVDRTSDLPPPVVVVVAGPPKVGKTTLIQALVKHYARKRVSKVQGPITVISGKGENKTTKRLTFIESQCDIHSMTDVAKVADLVVLMMNGGKNHQMETFEFLTLCRALNFTKILGVVSHLDLMKTNKIKKKRKKMFKTRFWSEVCQGAKIHYLDTFDKGSYMKNQVRILSHSISRFRYAPRTWLTTHPYIIADRMEDITNPEDIRKNPVVERTVCLFGYVRGTFFNSQIVHIPGCGDYAIKDISIVPDPCPPLDQIKKRSLNDRERRLYAPMAGVGGILYDRDAIYMDIGGSHALRNEEQRKGPIGELISSLKDVQGTLDEKIASSGFNGEKLGFESDADSVSDDDESNDEMASDMDIDSDDDEDGGNLDESSEDNSEFEDDENSDTGESDTNDDDEEGDDDVEESSKKRKKGSWMKDGNPVKKRKKDTEMEDDDDDGISDEDESDVNSDTEELQEGKSSKWKENLKTKGIEAFHGRNRLTIQAQIYSPPKNVLPESDDEADDDLIAGLFKSREKKQGSSKQSWIDDDDCTATSIPTAKETFDELSSKIRDCFVTGKFAEGEDAESALRDQDELYGDSDDAMGSDNENNQSNSDGYSDDDKYSSDEDEEDEEEEEDKEAKDNDEDPDKPPENETPEERRERRMKAKLLAKKKRQRELFNNSEDGQEKTLYERQREEMGIQAETNRNEFKDLDPEMRVKVEGFRPGLYVRVELKIDCEFVKYFDARYPIILGGILPKEDELGFVTAKIQVHRYQNLALRDRDPALISLGWRRLETTVLFSMQQDNFDYRTIKQARPCVSCMATFWGPVTPQGTSLLMYSTDPVRKFRITAVGSVSKQDKCLEIIKKLPLIGYPYKISKNTAFIQNMFNSSLEVAKFERAAIQTVSGVRGTIKKVAGEGPPGTFRATFEDKIKKSDIILLKATTAMDKSAHKYWQTVPNYLLPLEQRNNWTGMKLRYHLEKEKNIKRSFKPDSAYREINRLERVFKPLVIPRVLEKELPYKDKPKVDVKRKDPVQSNRIAVIKEPHERRRDELMKRILAVDVEKRKARRLEMRNRAAEHQKKMTVIEAKKKQKQKIELKKAYAAAGRASKHKKSNK